MRQYTKELISLDNVLEYWLLGTTCHRPDRISIHWISPNQRWVLMKHHGHSEWCGGWVGQSWCGTYYDLLKIGDPFPDATDKSPYYHIDGRVTKSNMIHIRSITA